jgi:hypothetical protein
MELSRSDLMCFVCFVSIFRDCPDNRLLFQHPEIRIFIYFRYSTNGSMVPYNKLKFDSVTAPTIGIKILTTTTTVIVD